MTDRETSGWDLVALDQDETWLGAPCSDVTSVFPKQLELETRTRLPGGWSHYLSLFEELVVHVDCDEVVLSGQNPPSYAKFVSDLRLGAVVELDTSPPTELVAGDPDYWTALGAERCFVRGDVLQRLNIDPVQWARANHA